MLVLLLAWLSVGTAVRTCKSEHLVKMSDGTLLTTLLTIPEPCDQKYPCVMDATPYGPTVDLFSETYVPEGFIAVMQNQRGCFTSGGLYDFWKMDGPDHYDTMAWILNQTWTNGEIFTCGISADANSAYADYEVANPWVQGGYEVWGSAFGHETCYWNGAYRGGLISHWLLSLGTCPNAPNIETQVRQNEAYTTWWAPIEANSQYGNNFPNVISPSIHQAGWWDIFQQPQISTFEGVITYGAPNIRNMTWLWVIPLGHCTLNGFDFPGFEIADPQVQSVELFKKNFSSPLWSYIDQLNFYVFGPVPAIVGRNNYTGNYYTSLPQWPTFTPTLMYAGPNGILYPSAPTTQGSLTYTYNPNNPAPQLSGNNLYGPCGPNAENSNEARSDYLLWTTTAPFTQDTAFVGHFYANITVTSTAVDTDFIVSINDVYPTGQSIPVRYGPVRMRWAISDSDMTPQMMTPGQMYTVYVDMWSMAYIFNAGHSMRLTITSSRNPEISVNPNNGLPLSDGLVPPPLIIANNTVFWGPGQQTVVVLPLVSLSQIPKNPKIH